MPDYQDQQQGQAQGQGRHRFDPPKVLTREQAQEVQRLATQMAQQQMQRAYAVTSNFITTVVSLVSSALGFVAAFAWNTFIQAWLNSVYNVGQNSVQGKLIYAIAATVFAVVVIGLLGIVTSRMFRSGRNMIPPITG